MTWRVPDWWATVLLAIAAFRTWKLLADDAILDRPRAALLRRLPDKAGLFLICPWCLGFWVALSWWLAFEAWPHWSLIAAIPFALSALVGLLATILDSG